MDIGNFILQRYNFPILKTNYIFVSMNKLIWKYLDKTHPNAYRKRTKFGLVPYGENGIIPYLNLIRDVSELFGEERRSHLIIDEIFHCCQQPM